MADLKYIFSRFRLLSYLPKIFIKILVSVIKWLIGLMDRLSFSLGLVRAHLFPLFSFVAWIIRNRQKKEVEIFLTIYVFQLDSLLK